MNATANAIGRLEHTVLAVADPARTIAFHGRVPDVRRFESSARAAWPSRSTRAISFRETDSNLIDASDEIGLPPATQRARST